MSVAESTTPPQKTSLPLWQQFRWTLVFYFVLLVAISMTSVAIVIVNRTSAQVNQQVTAQLESVAQLKAEQIKIWLNDTQAILKLAVAGPRLVRMQTFLTTPKDDATYKTQLNDHISLFQELRQSQEFFEAFFLYTPEGRVVASSDEADIGKIVVNQPYYQPSLVKAYFQPPYYAPGANHLIMIATYPVTDKNGRTIGVIAARLSTEPLLKIMEQRAGLGKTGETYLVSAESNYFITPSRYEQQGYTLTRAYHSYGIDQALEGKNGSGIYGDYREPPQQVIGVYRWMPELGAALLAEQDVAEALAGAQATRNFVLFLTALAIVIAGVAGGYAATRVSAPILELAAVARRIAAGDMTARAQIHTGEVGLLANAFNTMVEQVESLLQSVEARRAELEERTRELEASQRVTFAASERVSPDALLDLVVNLIRDQFNLYHAQVYIVDEQQQAAVLRQSTGYAGRQLLQKGHKIPLDRPALVTKAINTGQPVLVDDTTQTPDFMPNPLLPDTRSELVVPLKVGDKVIGALDAQDRTPGRFSASTVALFQTMTDQVAFLFENNALIEQVNERSKALMLFTNQLRTAADIARRLGAVLDPEQLLDQLVSLLQSRFGLYHAHIYTLDREANKLVVRAGSGEVGRVLRERGHSIPLDAEKSLVARAARERQAIVVDDTSLVSDFMPNPLLPQTRAELAVPLIFGDQVIGVLDVQDDQAHRFTQADVDTFGTLAGLVATALQNAQLFTQVQTERALTDSILRNMPVGVMAVDKNFGVLRVNEAAQQMLGRQVTDREGNTYVEQYDVINIETGERYDETALPLVKAVTRGGQHTARDAGVRKPDGTIVPMFITAGPLLDPAGQQMGGVVIFADTTEQRQAELAVRESERRYRELLSGLRDGFAVVSLEGNITACNPTFEQITGYTLEELKHMRFQDLTPEKWHAMENEILTTQVLARGYSDLYEKEYIRKDGSIIPVELSVYLVRDAQGNPVGFWGFIRDITERKQAEQALKQQEEKFRTVADFTYDWEYWLGADGKYVYVSPACERITGYSVSEFVQDPTLFQAIVHPDDQDILTEHMRRYHDQHSEAVGEAEFRIITRDGQERWIGHVCQAVHSSAGEWLGRRASNRDITEQKQAEIALQESVAIFTGFSEASNYGFGIADLEGNIVLVNPALLRMLGEERVEDVQKKRFASYYPEDKRKVLTEEVMPTIMAGRVWTGELALCSVDGRLTPTEESFFTIRDADGRPRYIADIITDITERKQAELELRRLGSAVEQTAEGIAIADLQGNLLFANRAWAAMHGYTPEEIIGKHLSVFHTPEQLEREVIPFNEQGRAKGFHQGEVGHVRRDGTVFPTYMSSTILKDDQGTPIGMVGTARDITEEKLAAQERERFTLQLSTAASIATQIGAILDPNKLLDTVITLLKEKFNLYHVHFYALDEEAGLLNLRAGYGEPGRLMLEKGHSIPLDREQSLVARAARTRQPVVVQDVTQAPDFMPNPLLPHTRAEVAVPAMVGGKVLGVFDVQHDQPNYFTQGDVDVFQTLAGQIATALQNADLFEQTQARLRVNQALLGAQTEEQVLDAMIRVANLYPGAMVSILTFDPDSPTPTLVTRRADAFDSGLQIMTQPHQRYEASQFPLIQHLSPDQPFISPNLLKDERTDAATRAMAQYMGITATAALPLTAGGEWMGIITATSKHENYFDKRKLYLYQALAEQSAIALRTARLYDETQKVAERLREVDRLKSEFLANMSHELRTPLNSIIGYAELMLMNLSGQLDERTLSDAQAIMDNGQHLLHMINDILDMAKIEAGRLTLNMDEIELAPLLEELTTTNAGLLVNKPIELALEIASDLPTITADRVRLTQIVNNLLSNAIKFTEQGRVTLRAYRQDEHVCIEVQDTGVGIAEQNLGVIFERFRQVDGSNARRAEGTGLGLSITSHLVRMHGGTIDVKSKLGEGSTFTVRLPIPNPAT